MVQWLQGKLIWILLILLIVSVGGNAYLFWGKGIKIDKNTYVTSTTTSYANSGASAINNTIMGTTFYSANKKTEYQMKEFTTIEDALVFINTKNEGELYNYRILNDLKHKEGFGNITVYRVIYRNMDIEFKNEGSVTIKTINGKEVK